MTSDTLDDDQLSRLNTELLAAYKEEGSFWKQRSRILWLTLGEKNTSYFHAVAKGRQSRNRLTLLENSQGETLYEEELIGGEIAKFFNLLFTTTNAEASATVLEAISPLVTPSMNELLVCPPMPSEIKKALFSIHPDKDPGPDGFSASFFQSNWAAISSSIISEIQRFF